MDRSKRPELLMPAGSLEQLKIAVIYGADAVYVGGPEMNLRAAARGITVPEIREGVAFAHERGAKVYVAANIFAHNSDLRAAMKLFLLLKPIMPDALIISDPGVFSLARSLVPEIPVHISTQANNTNYATFDFWYRQGVRRVVAARELSLTELSQIKMNIPEDMEIEAFVHGAMCMSYSGRCLISSFLTGRDANQGACTHPCRWEYSLVETSRPGEYMPVEEDGRGTYLYFSKDLCMIDHMEDIAAAGIDSVKVEGRMKNSLYVATLARAYRRAIDECSDDPGAYRRDIPWLLGEAQSCAAREFCTGFYYGRPGSDSDAALSAAGAARARYLGTLFKEDGRTAFVQKNRFSVGDRVEIIRPWESVQATVLSLRTEDGTPVDSCPHASQRLYIGLDTETQDYDILRSVE